MLGVGVFDGHSGPEASKYVSEHLWNEVRTEKGVVVVAVAVAVAG